MSTLKKYWFLILAGVAVAVWYFKFYKEDMTKLVTKAFESVMGRAATVEEAATLADFWTREGNAYRERGYSDSQIRATIIQRFRTHS